MGVGLPSCLGPADEGVRRTAEDGKSIVYDPRGILAGLLDACGRSGPVQLGPILEVPHAVSLAGGTGPLGLPAVRPQYLPTASSTSA